MENAETLVGEGKGAYITVMDQKFGKLFYFYISTSIIDAYTYVNIDRAIPSYVLMLSS